MRAVVYIDPGLREIAEAPKPVLIHPTDAIVRIEATTICGTDLHIMKGDVPAVKPGTISAMKAVGLSNRSDRLLIISNPEIGCFYPA